MGDSARLLVFFQGKHALAYEITVLAERAAALTVALAAHMAKLGRLDHAGFSQPVAGIAANAAVKDDGRALGAAEA